MGRQGRRTGRVGRRTETKRRTGMKEGGRSRRTERRMGRKRGMWMGKRTGRWRIWKGNGPGGGRKGERGGR